MRISARASAVNEPGTYAIESINVSQIEPATSEAPYQCIVACAPCDVTATEINADVVAGSLQCAGLRLCTEPTLRPDFVEGGPCGARTAHVLDIDAQFRLTESSTKRKDY